MPIYEEVLKEAAAEAAQSAIDAHGTMDAPQAWLAYEFVWSIWDEIEEPALAYLPQEMPLEFADEFDRLIEAARLMAA